MKEAIHKTVHILSFHLNNSKQEKLNYSIRSHDICYIWAGF